MGSKLLAHAVLLEAVKLPSNHHTRIGANQKRVSNGTSAHQVCGGSCYVTRGDGAQLLGGGRQRLDGSDAQALKSDAISISQALLFLPPSTGFLGFRMGSTCTNSMILPRTRTPHGSATPTALLHTTPFLASPVFPCFSAGLTGPVPGPRHGLARDARAAAEVGLDRGIGLGGARWE